MSRLDSIVAGAIRVSDWGVVWRRAASASLWTVGLLVLVLLWSVLSADRSLSAVVPSPWEVLARLAAIVGPDGAEARANIVLSAARIVCGVVLGTVAGVLLAMAMAWSTNLRAVIEPLLDACRPLPPLALTPLLVIWFGFGELPKLLILVFVVAPIVAISTLSAVLSVDLGLIKAARVLGADRRQVRRWVTVPAAIAGTVWGIRTGTAVAWSALVAAEMVSPDGGLGLSIVKSGQVADTAGVVVSIIIIGALGALMDTGLGWLERATNWARIRNQAAVGLR
jgi:taurine transport system permease protein